MRFLAQDETRIAELAFFTTHPPFFRVILFYRTALGIDIARWQGGGSSPKQGKRRRIPGCWDVAESGRGCSRGCCYGGMRAETRENREEARRGGKEVSSPCLYWSSEEEPRAPRLLSHLILNTTLRSERRRRRRRRRRRLRRRRRRCSWRK